MVMSLVNGLVKGPGHGGSFADDTYKVHVAVLTANIGKMLPVMQGNHLSSILWKAMRDRGGTMQLAWRTNEVGSTFFTSRAVPKFFRIMITMLLKDIAKPLSHCSNSRTVITALCHGFVCICPFHMHAWLRLTSCASTSMERCIFIHARL